MYSALSRLGPIEKLDVNTQRGFGMVLFKKPETADLAISKRWYSIGGKEVEMLPYVPDKEARKALA